VKELEETLDWDPEQLRKCVKDAMRELPNLTDQDLYARWRYALSELGKVRPVSTLDDVGKAILSRAARAVGIKTDGDHDWDMTESDAVARCIRLVFSDLRKRLAKATPEEQARLSVILENEIAKLSSADAETLRRCLKVEKLSGKVLLEFVTSTGGFGLVQAFIVGQGFAPYLILTTIMKAFSVWIGMTFPFAAYTTATTALAAALSSWVLMSVGAVAGAAGFHVLEQKLHDELAKMVLIVGWVRATKGGA
jgi:hypothetical protein